VTFILLFIQKWVEEPQFIYVEGQKAKLTPIEKVQQLAVKVLKIMASASVDLQGCWVKCLIGHATFDSLNQNEMFF